MLEALLAVLIVSGLIQIVGTALHTMALNRLIAAFAQQTFSVNTYNAMVAAQQQGPERTTGSEIASGGQPPVTAGSTPAPVHPVHVHTFRNWAILPQISPLLDTSRCCNITTGDDFCEGCFHTADCPSLEV